MIRYIAGLLSIILLAWALPCLADASHNEVPPPLTPGALLEAFHAHQLLEYSCPDSSRCEVRCNGKDSKDEFHYLDVRRLEIAPGKHQWLLTAAHLDAVGKGHQSSAMLPAPVSCILDDLKLDRVSHFANGQLTRPDSGKKVVFDVEPQPPAKKR